MTAPVAAGDILAGKYRVERTLGQGGMGYVVAAQHLALGERVAIKFLLPQALARPDVVQRFQREARAAARIKSEHVARVHDVGTLESGAPYLVMEYLEGKDLAAMLRERGQLPVAEAVEYVLQACEALAEAHALGVVHRDLKPGNLFLTRKLDGSACVKIIDFGISKVIGGHEGEADMTATAVMMGSPLFMAPEQMASARSVDGRADVYSLGVILYTLLAGGPPFRGPSVMEIFELVLKGPPSLRTTRPDVPEALDLAVQRCLAKDREARFPNVGELATAIAPFGPIEARASAARAMRVTASTGATAAPLDVAAGLTNTAAAMTPGTPPPPIAIVPPIAPDALAAGSATDGSWGNSARPPRKGAPIGAILGAVFVAATLGIGAFLFLRPVAKPPVGASSAAAAETVAGAPTTTANATTTAWTSATIDSSAAPSATASATTQANATASAVANNGRPRVATTAAPKASAHPDATSKPKDHFSEPF